VPFYLFLMKESFRCRSHDFVICTSVVVNCAFLPSCDSGLFSWARLWYVSARPLEKCITPDVSPCRFALNAPRDHKSNGLVRPPSCGCRTGSVWKTRNSDQRKGFAYAQGCALVRRRRVGSGVVALGQSATQRRRLTARGVLRPHLRRFAVLRVSRFHVGAVATRIHAGRVHRAQCAVAAAWQAADRRCSRADEAQDGSRSNGR
jgi:hypothetical protein